MGNFDDFKEIIALILGSLITASFIVCFYCWNFIWVHLGACLILVGHILLHLVVFALVWLIVTLICVAVASSIDEGGITHKLFKYFRKRSKKQFVEQL